MTQLEGLVEYLMLDLLFEGGFLYWIIEMIYIMTFDRSQRQLRSEERVLIEAADENVPDWENPKVIGRHRRRAHAALRSFPDIPISVAFWSKRYQHAGWGDEDAEDDARGSPRKRKTSLFLPSTEVNSKAFKKHELTTNIMYLTGQCGEPDHSDPWRFKLIGEPSKAPEGWNQPTHNDLGRDWSDIALPGHWQLQGHDIPIYTNTSYPFAFDPPRARRTGDWKLTDCDVGIGSSTETTHPNGSALHPKEPGENPTGLYRRAFSLPKSWVDVSMPPGVGAHADTSSEFFAALPEHRVFLVFEGVDAAFNVYVNGVHVGYSQDSCLSAEFEITDALEARAAGKEHVVAVEVMRWCDGSYLEDQDKWWLSGIYREVYLLRKPATYICDYEFSSVLIESEREGDDVTTQIDSEYSLAVLVEETYPSDAPLAVRAELRRLDPHSPMGTGNAVSVSYGRVETNKDLPMRENANGLSNIESESGICEEKGFLDEDGDYMVTHTDWCRKQVRKFYQEYNPAKLDDVPGLLEKYQGRESEILHLLHEKYGVPEPRCSSFSVRDSKKRRGCAELAGKVTAPALWTAESPHLYVLIVTLHECMQDAKDFNSFMGSIGNTVPLDIESTRVGFRIVSFSESTDPAEEGKLCVNNVPITVCGVNRHEFHFLRGRAVSEKDMMHDASLLKQFNFNAVRLSHYPTHPRWLEICDECGLYVVDEANIETHGFQALGQATAYLSSHLDWQDAMVNRVTRMVERDKNHPCIVAWSLGNESGCGTTTRIMADWIRNRDFFRCVQYESGGARTTATDIICPMYQRPSWLRRHASKDSKRRPVILCEYAHAMGNSGGCLKAYWDDVWGSAYPRIQGGFVWDMIDQGLELQPDCEHFGNEENPGWGYGGDFGDLPNTRQFCINGLFGPDRLPHPMAYEVKACMSPVVVTLVESGSRRGQGDDEDSEDEDENEDEEAEGEEKEEHRSLNTVRGCFQDVARRNVRISIQNRRSFNDLGDLQVQVAFRCNLSGQRTKVLPEGSAESVPLSVDPYKTTVACAGVIPGGVLEVSVRDLFERVYEKSADHSLEQLLAMPSQASSPPSLLPYLQSSNITEAWMEVDVSVRAQRESAYVPAYHNVYRVSLPSEALRSALKRVADVKATERGYDMSRIGLRAPVVRRSIGAGIASPTKGANSRGGHLSPSMPQRSASILGSPSGSRFKGDQLVGRKEIKYSRGVHRRGAPGASLTHLEKAKHSDDKVVLVEWSNGAAAEVGERTGTLLSWHDENGRPFLSNAQPLELCLSRAATDNDRGGGPLSYYERWQAAGYNSLQASPRDVNGGAVLSLEFMEAPSTGSVPVNERERALRLILDWTQRSTSNPDTVIPAQCCMLFLPSGAIEVSFEVTVSPTLPILPRVGVRFSCPVESSMDGDDDEFSATWLGEGPHESYADRRECNSLGLFTAPLTALHTPYVVPGENGMRLDPRFLALRGDTGTTGALVIIPASENGYPALSAGAGGAGGGHAGAVQGYSFSVSPFSMEQLAACHHNHLLSRGEDHCAFVHVDAVHMGVGGYDSWSPNVDYQHQISPALPPLDACASPGNTRVRQNVIKGSVLLGASRWSSDQGSFLYNEFQRMGLW